MENTMMNETMENETMENQNLVTTEPTETSTESEGSSALTALVGTLALAGAAAVAYGVYKGGKKIGKKVKTVFKKKPKTDEPEVVAESTAVEVKDETDEEPKK